MMRLLFLFSLLFLSETASAFQLSTDYEIGADQKLNQEIRLQCNMSDESNACAKFCGNTVQCIVPTPLCRNCYGTSSDLLREIFTDIPHSFVGTSVESSALDFINFLKADHYALIDDNSAFNYYVPLKSPQLLAEMRSLCPSAISVSTMNPLLLVSLDAENLPKELQYVICRDEQGNDAAYGVALREGISEPMDGSVLKLTDEFLK